MRLGMPATTDNKTALLAELISSCYKAREGYRSAASTVSDEALKRLFELYAQQRTRFAEELREYLPFEMDQQLCDTGVRSEAATGQMTKENPIEGCLKRDASTLALYRETLARRTLPIRTHFLISSQLALMQGVYDRVQQMLMNERPAARPRLQIHTH